MKHFILLTSLLGIMALSMPLAAQSHRSYYSGGGPSTMHYRNRDGSYNSYNTQTRSWTMGRMNRDGSQNTYDTRTR
ncbi:MAG: hypothetical protein GX130_08985, partial [Candidatus Hydrogenedens sp.]|nr:hypothetical protein [Candidatus Hydrogenedens sp.]